MNPAIIEREYPPNDPEAAYLVEVARRLERILVLRKIDPLLASALAFVLPVATVRYRDGFVTNPIDDFQKIIGDVEAVMIVEALVPGLPPKWRDAWRSDPKKHSSYCDELRVLLASDPTVVSVE